MAVYDENNPLTENEVKRLICQFLYKKKKANWKQDKTIEQDLHKPKCDLVFTGGSRNGERLFIECKGKSYAKSARSINSEGWLNALGQIVTRIHICSDGKGDNNFQTVSSYRYGLGLCRQSAEVALRRIPNAAAKILNLRIYSVDDDGKVVEYTPRDFKS